MSATVKWNHSRAFHSFLAEDCKDEKWTDVFLIGSDGCKVKVHKVVLAASSSFVGCLLKDVDGPEDAIIIVPNIPGWVLKLLMKMVYGNCVLDAWAVGNEMIVEAAELLGLVPKKFASLNSMTISELTTNFVDKETMRDIELISDDLFKEISFTEELPMDIVDFFNNTVKEEETKPSMRSREPFIRKSVIQHAVTVRTKNKQSSENMSGLTQHQTNTSLINERKILSCERMSLQRRKMVVLLLSCPRCKYVFKTAEEKQEHAVCRGETILHNCIFKCKNIFTTFSLLCQHIGQDHRLNVQNMVKKVSRDPPKKSVAIQCRLCQAMVNSAQALQNHFRSLHPDEFPYICNICGHKTLEEVRFKRHMLCHKPETPRELCTICFKEFRNKVSLRTHKNMVHKLGRKYTCAFCGKVLYSSQYLKKHESTHTGEKFKGVVCKFCGKTVEYTKLKNHELTHTGEKPFKCSDCDYRCIQRSNLRIHMKGIHKKDLPRLAVGQKRYSGSFMDGTAGNNDPFDLRSVFHQKADK